MMEVIMGSTLVSYYDKAKQKGGIKAQMRLAVLTKLPTNRAKDAPDSPENIQLFENAMKELDKEFK
jgi:hypothetical protein